MADATAKFSARLKDLIAREPQLAFLGALAGEPAANSEGAEWFIVGGAVRDAILGRAARKDFDLLVRGVSLEKLAQALAPLGEVNLVGKRFGVLKFRPRGADGEVDIASPRTEHAGGTGGYRDFEVQADPALPIERDLERRDFTANAVAWDVARGAFTDPHDGISDILARVLRAVGDPDARFKEDYSRMLRAVRFACELGFEIDPATWDALTRLAPRINDLLPDGERVVPMETVAREFVKAMVADPVRAVRLLEASGLLFALFPELAPLAGCAQPEDHHSEGDVWTHTKLALARLRSPEFAKLFPDESPSAQTIIATLFHDVAKPQTVAIGAKGQTVFYGHAEKGAEIMRAVGARLRLDSVPGVSLDRLEWLVKMHLVPNSLRVDEVRKTTLEKHFLRDRAAGRELLHLAAADALASIHEDGTTDLSALRAVLAALAELESRGFAKGEEKKLLSGEEIMEITGFGPGPSLGKIIEALREAQLSGQVKTADEAREYLKRAHEHD